jgi:hypothetical protein
VVVGRQGPGLKAGKSERKRKRLISQSVRHRERKRDRERKQRSRSRNECKKRGKKKRQSDGNRNDKTKQIKKTPKTTKPSACLLLLQAACKLHPSPPSSSSLVSANTVLQQLLLSTHKHTHTLSLSLSFSLSKLESTTPWAPEKHLD